MTYQKQDDQGGIRSLREQKKAECRRTILHAARDSFEEKGFHATTMNEVASKSGVSVATLFNYFPSKQKLLFGVHSMKMNDFRKILDENTAGGHTALEKLLLLFDSHLEDIYAFPRLSLLIYERIAYGMIPDDVHNVIKNSISSLTQSAIRNGELVPDTNVRLLKDVFFGLGYSAVLNSISREDAMRSFEEVLAFYRT